MDTGCATVAVLCHEGSTIPYRWFRYALLVSTVAQVHFLTLKSLVCILISMGSTWDIGTKFWYVLPQGFESRMCTLTIPTICTINTMMKVVKRIKQWCNFLANNSGCRYSPRPHLLLANILGFLAEKKSKFATTRRKIPMR